MKADICSLPYKACRRSERNQGEAYFHSLVKKVHGFCTGVANFISGDHPNATIFHPQWLAIRAQFLSARYAAKFANGLLVDVGCGRKPFDRIFRPNVKAYIGIDYPLTAHMVGGSKADIFATVLELPVRSASVDTVLLTEVLEHLPEPMPVLSELHRILKPQGVLILTAPMIYNVHGDPYDFFRFTPDGLRYILGRSGFRIIDLKPQGYFGTMLGLMVNNAITVFFARTQLLRIIRLTILLLILPFVFAFWNLAGLILDTIVQEMCFSFDHLVIAKRV